MHYYFLHALILYPSRFLHLLCVVRTNTASWNKQRLKQRPRRSNDLKMKWDILFWPLARSPPPPKLVSSMYWIFIIYRRVFVACSLRILLTTGRKEAEAGRAEARERPSTKTKSGSKCTKTERRSRRTGPQSRRTSATTNWTRKSGTRTTPCKNRRLAVHALRADDKDRLPIRSACRRRVLHLSALVFLFVLVLPRELLHHHDVTVNMYIHIHAQITYTAVISYHVYYIHV